MAFCTKFKIATWFSSISPRIQSYSSVQKDGEIRKNRLRNKRLIKNAQIIDKTNECSRSAFHKDCFASGASAKYMEYLFYKWVKNVNSVHKSWNYYFNDLVGTKKIVSKPKKPNEFKVVLDDLTQAHDSTDPEPIAEMQKWIQQSNQQSNRQPTTNMSSNGPNSLPPLTPEQPTIVGHINLSPFKDAPSAPKSIKDLMEHQPKSKSSVMKKTQHFPNMKEVKTAIQRKRISAGQNEMAKQSKKTDSSGGILTKKSNEPTRK